MTDDSVREAAASVRVWPVSGEAQAAYSVDALQYNATTQDWRTHAGVDLTAAVGHAGPRGRLRRGDGGL